MRPPVHHSGPTVRLASLRELDGILAVQGAAPEAAQWPRAVYAEMLQRPIQPGPGTVSGPTSGPMSIPTSGVVRAVFCAMQGELVTGFAVVAMLQLAGANECELENMAIDPVWRHRGLGRRLVEAVLAWCQERNALQLSLEVRASNSAALGLYATMGFHPVGRRFQYYTQPVEDAILMTRAPRTGP
ncbi:MAG: GNAT family N-acetyltransferase [Acidobacteriaceae bacterium]